ncbi:hypothetical protein F385_1287 [Pantoea agglomerans 299R]|nr:hypothetical protein F385_1287 [Pantoea agglomerans 299R]
MRFPGLYCHPLLLISAVLTLCFSDVLSMISDARGSAATGGVNPLCLRRRSHQLPSKPVFSINRKLRKL